MHLSLNLPIVFVFHLLHSICCIEIREATCEILVHVDILWTKVYDCSTDMMVFVQGGLQHRFGFIEHLVWLIVNKETKQTVLTQTGIYI